MTETAPAACIAGFVTSAHTDFYAGVEAAAAALAGSSGLAPAARAVAVHAAVGPLLGVDPLLGAAAPDQRACRIGCDHCCRLPVGIAFAEAELLVAALAAAPELRSAVLTDADATADLPWSRLVGRSCPLTRTGGCAVYAARPLPCRALASSNARACAEALDGRPNPAIDGASFWRGLGASDVLARDGDGTRELRSALAAMLRSPADPVGAFRSARPAGDAPA